MASILPSLALLACPVGMGLMMWFMAKGNRKQDPAPVREQSLEEMRQEQRRLDDEISRAERPERAATR